jgi:sigma-B regulation protein RsbU (phosphoserine phosphatase)
MIAEGLAARRAQQLRKLTEVSRALTSARDLDEVLSLTVARAAELLDSEKVVLILSGDDDSLAVRASRGLDDAAAGAFRDTVQDGLSERLAALLGGKSEEFLAVPLVMDGNVTGFLAVTRRAGDSDPEDDEWLLSALADQVAVALEMSRLDETAAFRERLIGIIGHDLRNPLQAISMGSDYLLMHGTIGQAEMKAVRRIAGSASRMAHLIDQLLDFTRARLGSGIVLDRQQSSLSAVCSQVVDEIAVANPSADLQFQAEGDAESLWDRQRLAQVFSNLIKNALQHGAAGRPIVVRLRENHGEVVVEIHNEGPPIAPDLLPRLFDPFRQGSPQVGRSTSSMGLGLYIADQVVRAHDGEIAVTSTADHGTTFKVTLPLAGP